jgi:hypothetical protein
VVASAVIVGVVSGFGSSGPDPKQVVAETFGKPHDYSSGRLNARIGVEGGGITGANGIAVGLQGPWSSRGGGAIPSFAMDTDLSLGSRNVRVRLISNGESGWVDFAGLTYKLPDSVFGSFKEAWAGNAGSGGRQGSLLDRLGFKPSDWIKDPKTVGDENVGGVETVHVTADLDSQKLVADVASLLTSANKAGGGLLSIPGLSDAAAAQLGGAVEEAKFDLWSGKEDSAIRKLTVTVRTRQAGPLPPLKLDFSVAIDELNRPQTIEVPKNAESFGGVAGLLAGAAGLLGGDAGGEDPAAKAYSDCVAKAKDTKSVNDCLDGLVK